MAKYAENTSVSSEKSRSEIERTLQRYGATGFAYGWETDKAIIAFKLKDRHIRFTLTMPDRKSNEISRTPGKGWSRSLESQNTAYDKAVRQRWRALALIVKAKLEAVDSGIVTIEEEFLAHIILPDNRTVSEWVAPQIEKAYLSGQMPKLLPGIGETE